MDEGRLRFAPASVPSIVGPIIVWQVLHTIAGVRHLVRIESQLALLQRGIQQVILRLRAPRHRDHAFRAIVITHSTAS
jgi:hypothetical protein